MSAKSYEITLRREAARFGLILEKDRARRWAVDHRLGWRVIDRTGRVVAGDGFSLPLEAAAEVIRAEGKRLKAAAS
jgi:hypothetical protein